VQVYERTEADLSDRGAGIGTREELFAVLARIGAHLDPASTSTVAARARLDRNGTASNKIPLKSISSSWAHLYHCLRAALPATRYHRGKALQHVEQDGATVAAIFDDNQRVQGELLIGGGWLALYGPAAVPPRCTGICRLRLLAWHCRRSNCASGSSIRSSSTIWRSASRRWNAADDSDAGSRRFDTSAMPMGVVPARRGACPTADVYGRKWAAAQGLNSSPVDPAGTSRGTEDCCTGKAAIGRRRSHCSSRQAEVPSDLRSRRPAPCRRWNH
jgi:hypothetical protein